MLIGDWMTKQVHMITPDTSMMKASKIMKDNDVRRLPVVDEEGRLIGIVSDRDVKEASPSKATTLDVHELYYLLSEIKAKDIMTRNPYRIKASDTVEKAAVIMTEKRVGGLPVVDDDNKVVGMITDSDVFKVLIAITGVKHGGVQMAFKLPNAEGALKAVLDDLKGHNARIMSILTAYDQAPEEGVRHVYIRIHDMDKSTLNAIKDSLARKHQLLYWVRDNVESIVA